MSLYKKCIAKLFSFLVKDATLPSDSPLRFRCNLLERASKVIIKTDERLEIRKYGINREAAKILSFSSSKIDKHEYITGE